MVRVDETIDATASGEKPASLLVFLIADVRGYTSFTAEYGDEAGARLADRFAAHCESVVSRHDGQVIELRGDEALCVFTSARDGLRGAVALQQSFQQAVADDPSLPLNVGMGVDAGEAVPLRGGYRGGALNLASRLCSIAGAGEILVSDTVVALARKTEGLAFVERGRVTLKGLPGPVRVLQIAAEGQLPDQLPPLGPMLLEHPSNLPDDATPFIGRERDIREIAAQLKQPSVRLVTLTGPGGTGKTRLALQVGNTLLYDFSDGVFFCDLSPISEPALVPCSIARVFGIKEEPGRALTEMLFEHLSEKRLLLVLDNLEQVIGAAPVIGNLLDTCRELRVLTTSRIPLHLAREHEYPVSTLSVPDLLRLPDLNTLSQFESVALFVERAAAVYPGFTVTEQNAPIIAEICSRLDGLPLAIELAAARIKIFPPRALLERLHGKLGLLTGGAKDRPDRQQTLRGAIDWSYSLLTTEEQTLFARLSVFVGGCTFEALEAVCVDGEEVDAFEAIASLVDKSLLRQVGDDEPRFSMLETIQEYAEEKLVERGEQNVRRDKHLQVFADLASVAEPELGGENQVVWLNRLEVEHHNLRAALEWSREAGGEALPALAGSLWRYWYVRGRIAEGRQWLDAAIDTASTGPLPHSEVAMIKVLLGAGVFAYMHGEYDRAESLIEESLRLARGQEDPTAIALALNGLGDVAETRGQHDRARELYEESLKLERECSDTRGIAQSLQDLGLVARSRGDDARAAALFEESLRLERELGDTAGIARSLNNLGDVAEVGGDYERARELFEESLRLERDLRNTWGIASSLVGLGVLEASQHEYHRATTLLAAAAILWETAGLARQPDQHDRAQAVLGEARQALTPDDYDRARRSGAAMDLDEIVEYACEEH